MRSIGKTASFVDLDGLAWCFRSPIARLSLEVPVLCCGSLRRQHAQAYTQCEKAEEGKCENAARGTNPCFSYEWSRHFREDSPCQM